MFESREPTLLIGDRRRTGHRPRRSHGGWCSTRRESTTMVGSGDRFRLSSRMSPDACISPSPAAQNTRCSPDFASPTEESPTGTRLSYQSGKRVRPAGFERRSHRSSARESTRRCDQPCSNLEETAQVNIEENTAQPAAQECANDTEEHRHEQAATLGTG